MGGPNFSTTISGHKCSISAVEPPENIFSSVKEGLEEEAARSAFQVDAICSLPLQIIAGRADPKKRPSQHQSRQLPNKVSF
jgi:hypothetical protein